MELHSFIGGCIGGYYLIFEIYVIFNLTFFLNKGFAGILSSYPFDTVKVRIQNQNIQNLKYKGAIDCLRKIIANESVYIK